MIKRDFGSFLSLLSKLTKLSEEKYAKNVFHELLYFKNTVFLYAIPLESGIFPGYKLHYAIF